MNTKHNSPVQRMPVLIGLHAPQLDGHSSFYNHSLSLPGATGTTIPNFAITALPTMKCLTSSLSKTDMMIKSMTQSQTHFINESIFQVVKNSSAHSTVFLVYPSSVANRPSGRTVNQNVSQVAGKTPHSVLGYCRTIPVLKATDDKVVIGQGRDTRKSLTRKVNEHSFNEHSEYSSNAFFSSLQ